MNFPKDKRGSATIRTCALTGVALTVAALVAPGLASAQTADDLQQITITGSRIKAPNLTSESPVTGVTDAEIKQEGTTNLENLLNNLPQLSADQSNTISNTADGTAHLDLRGLGATRTLVLIDGRRLGPSDPSNSGGAAADINFIPAALVSSVEVLTGGASAIYGSDAVAGVVNFHLLHDFNGAMFDETYTMAQHDQGNSFQNVVKSSTYPIALPSNQLDGFIRDTTGVVGASSADNKGNVMLYGEYRSTTPVLSGTRDWSACSASSNAAKTKLTCAGSVNSAYGYFLDNAGDAPLANNPNGSATFVPFTNALKYNFAPTNYLQRQDDRAALGAIGHYQVNPWLDIYTEAMFMDDNSTSQIAPAGLFVGGGPQGTLQVPCNNKYLSAAQAASICQDANGNALPVYKADGTPNVATITMPGLRFAAYPRQYTFEHEDYRAVLGARGDIDSAWSYDVSGSYWDSRLADKNLNDISFSRIQDSINGCASGAAGCVPINIFQYGGLTPGAVNYVSLSGTRTGSTKEETVEANITGDLGAYGIVSPLAKNAVATAFGLSYRRDSLSNMPDAEMQSGDLLSAGVQPAISGGEAVREAYGEVRIPIAENLPLVQAVNLDLALRHSDYTVDNSNSAFSTNTYKITADYAPTEDLRLRGGYNRAARAPNVYELFFPNTVGNETNADPCAGAAPTASFAACAKTGVTAAQYGKIVDCPAGLCSNLTGGNTALKPEEADTWTWGGNLTPSFLPGFNASIDYWDIQVSNYVSSLPGGQIVTGCLLEGVSNLCGLIHRAPSGILFGTNGYVVETNTNFGSVHNRGLDFELNYRKDLAEFGIEDMGSLALKMNGTYLLQATTSIFDSYDCAGLYGPTCANPSPVWRHQARLTWTSPWDFDLSLNWRYLAGVKLDSNSSQTSLNNGVWDAVDAKIPAYSYYDLSASWKVWGNYTIRAGVNNLLDKDPPVLNYAIVSGGGANGNTFSGIYDSLGRVMFANFNAKF